MFFKTLRKERDHLAALIEKTEAKDEFCYAALFTILMAWRYDNVKSIEIKLQYHGTKAPEYKYFDEDNRRA